LIKNLKEVDQIEGFKSFLENLADIYKLEINCLEQDLFEIASKGLKIRFLSLNSPFISDNKEIRIWEDQWITKKEIIKSRISSKVKINASLPARVCKVKKITQPEAKLFLDRHHLQNATGSRFSLGLFLTKPYYRLLKNWEWESDETLVAVMTFSNGRKFLEHNKEFISYEMLRFASLPFLNITGGLSKMIKAFIKEKSPGSIMTYIDKEWSDGNSLTHLGFEIASEKEPNFYAIDKDFQRIPVAKTDCWSCYNTGSLKMILKVNV
jgi:hypothetical protein